MTIKDIKLVALKRAASGQQLVQHDASGIDICSDINRLPIDLLWGHVLWCSKPSAKPSPRTLIATFIMRNA